MNITLFDQGTIHYIIIGTLYSISKYDQIRGRMLNKELLHAPLGRVFVGGRLSCSRRELITTHNTGVGICHTFCNLLAYKAVPIDTSERIIIGYYFFF